MENFITTYMEETQDQISDFITSDQFKCIIFMNGYPNLIIDFLSYITSCPDEIESIFT